MDELKQLLGMDLPEEVKSLLKKVSGSYSELQAANDNFMEAIKTKDNANKEAFDDRKKLRDEIAKLKEESLSGGNKDNSEQIEKLNKEWQEKYGELETSYSGLQKEVAENKRLNAFNSLNIPALFPKEWEEKQIDFAVKSIQRDLFEGSVYNHETGTWGYDDNGSFEFNKSAGGPYTIETKAKEMISAGRFDMFLAGKQGTGGGSNGSGQGTGGSNEPKTFREKQEALLAK